jgi:hypothetical protein
MRPTPGGIASCCILLPALAFAQAGRATCEHGFETGFRPGGAVEIHVRSGEIDIAGSDQAKVSVSCDLKYANEAKDVKIQFKTEGSVANLRISGGPSSHVRLRIRVPRHSHLLVRSPFGELTVSDVIGDKDVEMHAGDLTIAVGQPGDYLHADASVLSGDLTASAFGVNKGNNIFDIPRDLG